MQGKNDDPRLVLRVGEFQRLMRTRGCETASAQAIELGVYISTITRVTSGQVQPSGLFVARACDRLGVSIQDLFEVIPATATRKRSAA